MGRRPSDFFVFGSNKSGRHGMGAAKCAAQQWGAIHGIGEGMTGQSYAIPTKDHALQSLPIACIGEHVDRFASVAGHYYRNRFLLTEIGCGLAGHRASDVVPLFRACVELRNVYWPESWARRLGLRRISFDSANNLVVMD